MRVFLIHGMGRTTVSMALLARRLRQAGHDVSSYGYVVSRDALDVIGARFVEHITKKGGTAEPFAVVGHSLGNVITRMVLAQLPGLTRLVMLAPPNQPPALAARLQHNPIFRVLTQDAGRKLADQDHFYASLPVPAMPTLIVAGTRGPRFASSPWQGKDNDSVVGVDETRLEAPNIEHVSVDAIHTLIMNDAVVTGLVLRFLSSVSSQA
ncbi:MAG TPA: alpha/beta fold hydrolase [Myxococcota bacterium]